MSDHTERSGVLVGGYKPEDILQAYLKRKELDETEKKREHEERQRREQAQGKRGSGDGAGTARKTKPGKTGRQSQTAAHPGFWIEHRRYRPASDGGYFLIQGVPYLSRTLDVKLLKTPLVGGGQRDYAGWMAFNAATSGRKNMPKVVPAPLYMAIFKTLYEHHDDLQKPIRKTIEEARVWLSDLLPKSSPYMTSSAVVYSNTNNFGLVNHPGGDHGSEFRTGSLSIGGHSGRLSTINDAAQALPILIGVTPHELQSIWGWINKSYLHIPYAIMAEPYLYRRDSTDPYVGEPHPLLFGLVDNNIQLKFVIEGIDFSTKRNAIGVTILDNYVGGNRS